MALVSNTSTNNGSVVIPDETKKMFPELVKMIMNSQSMNDQERNYWLQVLPVMTEEQVAELRNILETEIKKLAEIEKKYSSGGSGGGTKKDDKPKLTDEEIKELNRKKELERQKRREAEMMEAKENNPDDILAQLGL
jgi:tryptophanyl-tRNA synthetase